MIKKHPVPDVKIGRFIDTVINPEGRDTNVETADMFFRERAGNSVFSEIGYGKNMFMRSRLISNWQRNMELADELFKGD